MGRNILSIFVCCLVLISCDQERVYDRYESLPNSWNRDSVISFEINAPDTLNTYNLFLNLRNNSNYNYSNIFLITEIAFPYGKVVTDTLQYEMTKPSGEWLGMGFGEVKENKLWFKEDFRFEEPGTYTFEIQQAMRKRDSVSGIEDLEGITEVGLRIEKSIN